MDKTKLSKRKIQGLQTKRRLMDCAISLFRDKGYHQVTVDEIIEQAGSSKGGFYTHFSSKEELLYSLLGRLDEVYMEFLDLDLSGRNAVEKISDFIEYAFKAIEERIGLEFIKVIYAAQIKDMVPDKFAVSPARKYYQILEKFLQEGKNNNEIQADLSIQHTIRLLTTGMRGVIYDWCLSNGNFSLSRYGSEIINILLQQLIT